MQVGGGGGAAVESAGPGARISGIHRHVVEIYVRVRVSTPNVERWGGC